MKRALFASVLIACVVAAMPLPAAGAQDLAVCTFKARFVIVDGPGVSLLPSGSVGMSVTEGG